MCTGSARTSCAHGDSVHMKNPESTGVFRMLMISIIRTLELEERFFKLDTNQITMRPALSAQEEVNYLLGPSTAKKGGGVFYVQNMA